MGNAYKVREMGTSSESLWKRYAKLTVGKASIPALIKYEFLTFFFGNLGGALGLFLRKRFYPSLFGSFGRGVMIGRNVTLRHPHKIHLSDNVIIDDNCVLDAKGEDNEGVFLGKDTFIGRNTIIYTKGGDISIGDNVNIGVNCDIYSKNLVTIGKNTMIAAYCYVMSGGQYDYSNPQPFALQSISKIFNRQGD